MLACDIFIVSQNQSLFFVKFIIPHPLSKKADKKTSDWPLGPHLTSYKSPLHSPLFIFSSAFRYQP